MADQVEQGEAEQGELGGLPTPEEVADALSHLPVERAIEYIRNAAGESGGWSPQLRKLEALVLSRGRADELG
jgi:hypothetical protein